MQSIQQSMRMRSQLNVWGSNRLRQAHSNAGRIHSAAYANLQVLLSTSLRPHFFVNTCEF